MVEVARRFLGEMEALLIGHYSTAAFIQMSPEQRQALTLNFALQALLQPGAWHAPSFNLDTAAFALASAIAAIGAEGSEEQSAVLVRHMINGYTAGRNEGIAARQQFKTTGRAN